ncbi:MAG: dTDP-glucose 4,6-dehydratase [Pelagibacteraceae bacterium TMED124]|nr:MAG: dTDP-glucose 4,6-dehydratase [Pelagibacteraceae bacterium TMED124]|tara:strand:+ start:7773 stop:8831 length:1059 start_codon:yes stop_codon:yes gene_type:complete
MTIFITGGAGFIGSNFILEWLKLNDEKIINIDNLTYSGNLSNLESVTQNKNYHFVRADICESVKLSQLFEEYNPRAIIHFAAESHVDRSIIGPSEFIHTNILGTFNLLEVVRKIFETGRLDKDFRFIHISTDEVYGSLSENEKPFTEKNQYCPNSPYSASKASSNHLARSYFETYKIPTIITNCSNNYGPYQFPEKLIPLVINNALERKEIPIYGDGKNIRDWLYVRDHCLAIMKVLELGNPGETYNIGGNNEIRNLDLVGQICEELDQLSPIDNFGGSKYFDLVNFVPDRPGHDRRYAIDSSKIKNNLNWEPLETFKSGMKKTISWYLDNLEWIANIRSGEYEKWIFKQYK